MLIINSVILLSILLAVIGLSVGIVRLFDWFMLRKKNDGSISDNNFERIRGKWLSVLSIYTAMLIAAYCIQLFFTVRKATTHEVAVEGFFFILAQVIVFFVIQVYLAYYFGYKKQGTKYIIFVLVLLFLNLASTTNALLAPLVLLYDVITKCDDSSIALKVSSISSVCYLIFFICLIILYIVRSIKLYKANKQHCISTTN